MFATIAVGTVLDDVVSGQLSFLVFLTFVGTKARLWEIHGLPASIVDDIVRAVAAEEAVDALAVVYAMAVPREVDADRAYNVSAECASGKFDSLIALKGGSGLGGEAFRIYGRRVEDIGPRWFGVEPIGRVEIWMEGIVGTVIRGGEA